jgi:hypothetical protein
VGAVFNSTKTNKKEFFEYTLVNSVRDWRTKWFYASNVQPSLAVHSDARSVVNDWWEKTPLLAEDLKRIKPFLERIKVLRQQGLTGFGIMASYLCHRV